MTAQQDRLTPEERQELTRIFDDNDLIFLDGRSVSFPHPTSKAAKEVLRLWELSPRLFADYDHLVEVARAYADRSIPQHSATCAGQDDEAECICGTSDLYERFLSALSDPATPEPVEGEPTDG